MPHLVILYTDNLDVESDMTGLCRTMADAMLGVKDEVGQQVFPTGGTRVFAYPAPHSAVADGQHDCAFAYFNVRMAQGRSDAVKKQAGIATMAVGVISSWDDANTIVAAGRADLVLLGREHLFNPYWTHHAAASQGYALPWPKAYASLSGYRSRSGLRVE